MRTRRLPKVGYQRLTIYLVVVAALSTGSLPPTMAAHASSGCTMTVVDASSTGFHKTCEFTCEEGDRLVVSGLGANFEVEAKCGGVTTSCIGATACSSRSSPDQVQVDDVGTCEVRPWGLGTFVRASCSAES